MYIYICVYIYIYGSNVKHVAQILSKPLPFADSSGLKCDLKWWDFGPVTLASYLPASAARKSGVC